ncbi:MAG TPA: hypothetical protein VNS88_14265 [Nitrospiraceae bacterium]|nr:hypothetical protein [Nitrospiraceae bacterium]
MTVARWSDAAFEQERLLGTIKHNPLFRHYISDFQEAAYENLFPEGMMLRLHEYMLQEADPMYVSSEVTDMWDYARESFKPEMLYAWDLPANISFALLPRPLTITDTDGNAISFRAISWIPASESEEIDWSEDTPPGGVWYTLWSHIDDGNDSFYRSDIEAPERESWEALGQWSILFSGLLPFGKSEDYEMQAFQDPGVGDDVDSLDNAIKVRRLTWILLQTFWRLSRQIVPTKAPLPRQLRRDRKRHYRTEDVTVITLRRQRHPDHPDHEAGEVDWKWQWVVRGHWRNQWYPSIKQHRQIWVMPYMKGPEDAPIKPVKRAFEFTR